jgi:hypothetical protein
VNGCKEGLEAVRDQYRQVEGLAHGLRALHDEFAVQAGASCKKKSGRDGRRHKFRLDTDRDRENLKQHKNSERKRNTKKKKKKKRKKTAHVPTVRTTLWLPANMIPVPFRSKSPRITVEVVKSKTSQQVAPLA